MEFAPSAKNRPVLLRICQLRFLSAGSQTRRADSIVSVQRTIVSPGHALRPEELVEQQPKLSFAGSLRAGRAIVCALSDSYLTLAQLTCIQNDLQHSVLICLWIAALETYAGATFEVRFREHRPPCGAISEERYGACGRLACRCQ